MGWEAWDHHLKTFVDKYKDWEIPMNDAEKKEWLELAKALAVENDKIAWLMTLDENYKLTSLLVDENYKLTEKGFDKLMEMIMEVFWPDYVIPKADDHPIPFGLLNKWLPTATKPNNPEWKEAATTVNLPNKSLYKSQFKDLVLNGLSAQQQIALVGGVAEVEYCNLLCTQKQHNYPKLQETVQELTGILQPRLRGLF